MAGERGQERVIARALRIIRAHPSILSAEITSHDTRGGTWVTAIMIRVNLPNAWAAKGQSPAGVRSVEPVTLAFPSWFPVLPPIIRLRADFDRTLAHVQPGDPTEPPEPCIVDGSLPELLHEQGLPGVLNQLVHWLENAALGRLIDPAQGWEPVRRDDVPGFAVADAAALRSLVSRKTGTAVFDFEYMRFAGEETGASYVYGEVGRTQLTLNQKTIDRFIKGRSAPQSKSLRYGHSLAVVAWAGRHPSGELVIADRYQPETVTDVGGLMDRAADYGCVDALRERLSWLGRCLHGYGETFPLAVILCARRPYHVIGSDSPIEICPYVVDVKPPNFLAAGNQTLVFPLGHRHTVAAPLLRRMSGDSGTGEVSDWVQVGCGSLGSKIALHLARAGRAPSALIDRGYLSPHNAARHALSPAAESMHLHWVNGKARALADAIEGLGQAPPTAATRDVITVSRDVGLAKTWLPRKSWAIVNATASLPVREALGSVPSGVEIPRVVETSLFASGQIGLLSVEGPRRNPDTLDLIAHAYGIVRRDETLRHMMFGSGSSISRQAVGEGCGSATMVMSDARISMFAAPIAEAIRRMQMTSLPKEGGRLLIGKLDVDGFGLSWTDHTVPPVVTVESEEKNGWTVRISATAAAKISNEVRLWPNAETGGILMGRISEAAQAFYVVDVLPAPEDSERSPFEFVLGTAGARRALRDYAKSCGFSLYCLGTWHSHLTPSGPSGTDRHTAAAVAMARLTPSILLIHTPAGYNVLVAEATETATDMSEDD